MFPIFITIGAGATAVGGGGELVGAWATEVVGSAQVTVVVSVVIEEAEGSSLMGVASTCSFSAILLLELELLGSVFTVVLRFLKPTVAPCATDSIWKYTYLDH